MPWMIPVVLRNLFSLPATRRYPYVKREPFERTRGKVSFDLTKCDGCRDCERICPSEAISVDVSKKEIGWDPFRCIYCHWCAEACWKGAISAENVYSSPGYAKEARAFTKGEDTVPNQATA